MRSLLLALALAGCTSMSAERVEQGGSLYYSTFWTERDFRYSKACDAAGVCTVEVTYGTRNDQSLLGQIALEALSLARQRAVPPAPLAFKPAAETPAPVRRLLDREPPMRWPMPRFGVRS